MRIVGNGFMATHFRPLHQRHADVVLFAAGVSSSIHVTQAGILRETAMLRDEIERCRRHGQRLVYFSSSGLVYGNYAPNVREDTPLNPACPYGRHKRNMESLVRAAGIDNLVVRLSNPVGRDQKGHQLLPSLANQVMQGRVTLWWGAHRDIIAIEDAVHLISRALEVLGPRDTINVASGHAVPVEWIVEEIEVGLRRRAVWKYIERPDNHSVDVSKLAGLLGTTPLFPISYPAQVIAGYLEMQSVCAFSS